MILLALLGLTLISALIRFTNLSPFKFYPDAYQSLLVAQNIKIYRSVVGYLGEHGTVFPDFVAWSRAGYPLLINLADIFFHDTTRSAQFVAVLAGVLAIPVVFLLIKNIFRSNLAGFLAALLLAISFNHVVWGGFILTETLGVSMVLVMLWLLFFRISYPSRLADIYDLMLGGVLTFAFLTRYEYIVWIIPISFLILKTNPTPFVKLINIIVSFLFFVSIFVSLYFPLQGVLSRAIISQVQNNLIQLALFVFVLAGVVLINFMVRPKWRNTSLLAISVWLIPLVLIFQTPVKLVGMRDFFKMDFLLGILALVGITLMFMNKKYITLGVFILFAWILFATTYYQINPLMERYTTHMIPILLIPASYGAVNIIKIRGKAVGKLLILTLILLLIYQVFLTYKGMKQMDNGTWFRESYEEKAAKIIREKIKNKDSLILVSFPESYYYHTKFSTHSITDYYPYVYIDESLNNFEITLILDMGMRDVFPNFTRLVEEKFTGLKIDEFWVGEVYHFADRIEPETKPVEVYNLTVKELKAKISP